MARRRVQGKVESSEVGLYLLGWRQVVRTPVCREESYALGWRRGAMRGLKARGWHGQLCILERFPGNREEKGKGNRLGRPVWWSTWNRQGLVLKAFRFNYKDLLDLRPH